jgi:hypothetical protein
MRFAGQWLQHEPRDLTLRTMNFSYPVYLCSILAPYFALHSVFLLPLTWVGHVSLDVEVDAGFICDKFTVIDVTLKWRPCRLSGINIIVNEVNPVMWLLYVAREMCVKFW